MDVAAKFPGASEALKSGFWTHLGVLGLSDCFEVLVQAVLADETRVPLVTISCRRQPVRLDFRPSLQPLMVTSWGRTGSTLLMKLLLEHPQIVGHGDYPYEARVGAYWMHLLKVMTEPANHFESAHPDNFTEDLQWSGHMPFYIEPLTKNESLEHWFGRRYVEKAASFCAKSIEEFYSELAASQGQSSPAYFAEKTQPIHTSELFWELYPRAREIFLVRDFRDVVCSMLAFNRKRGTRSFGSDRVSSEEEFVELQRLGARCLVQSWRRRRKKACVLRYEDLILRPTETLQALFQYLDIPDSRRMGGAIFNASAESATLPDHRTSRDSVSSIGRWKQDLSPSMQRRCNEAFLEMLSEFGYDTAGATEVRRPREDI